MERRGFLSALAAAALASRLPLRAQDPHTGRVTLLHTNDTHSRIEPFEPGSGKLAGRGGIARRATMAHWVRQAVPNVLLLDAGDVFQGTPYFNQFKGVVDYRLMSLCGYDAGTLGNHDFDNGVEGLLAALEEARFPILNCNFDCAGAPALAARLQPWLVKELPGVKVGLTGVGVAFEGLVSPWNHRGVDWRDPVAALKPVVRHLREREGADLVVLLSHLGYDRAGAAIDDLNLARLVPGIDVIIGGHTHTFMEVPKAVEREDGTTEIFQVGWAGVNLGRLDVTLRGGAKVACTGVPVPVLA
jgi:5'-nucleotidase